MPPASPGFILNDAEIDIPSQPAPSGLTILDFLRQRRRLTGTKEGCKEGDCGACVVLVGTPDGDALRYAPMTSCMMPLAEAAGRHVVTIEGLEVDSTSPSVLNCVQREIVAAGASQCGFCTPGIVVSLVGRLLDGVAPAADRDKLPDEVDRALSGHLCRCTGYRSLRQAAAMAFEALESSQGVAALVAAGELPAYFLDVPRRLRALASKSVQAPASEDPRERSGGTDIIAGGTDIYVQRGEELPVREVVSLPAERPELRGLEFIEQGAGAGEIRVGALTTFEDLAESPLLRSRLPAIGEWMELVASWQIRTRSTVGGNLVNASPIGDITILMLALGASAVFEDADGTRRSLQLDELYLGYKELDRRPSEILVEVRFPDLEEKDHVAFEKVSKRRWLDIATVNSAARLQLDGDVISGARFAAGGVAPIPLFLRRTSELAVGRLLDLETLRALLAVAQEEIAPISDVRGSAEYKRRLVENLLIAQLTSIMTSTFPERFSVDTIAGELFAGRLAS